MPQLETVEMVERKVMRDYRVVSIHLLAGDADGPTRCSVTLNYADADGRWSTDPRAQKQFVWTDDPTAEVDGLREFATHLRNAFLGSRFGRDAAAEFLGVAGADLRPPTNDMATLGRIQARYEALQEEQAELIRRRAEEAEQARLEAERQAEAERLRAEQAAEEAQRQADGAETEE